MSTGRGARNTLSWHSQIDLSKCAIGDITCRVDDLFYSPPLYPGPRGVRLSRVVNVLKRVYRCTVFPIGKGKDAVEKARQAAYEHALMLLSLHLDHAGQLQELEDEQLADKIMLKREEFVEKELGRKCYSPQKRTGAYAGRRSISWTGAYAGWRSNPNAPENVRHRERQAVREAYDNGDIDFADVLAIQGFGVDETQAPAAPSSAALVAVEAEAPPGPPRAAAAPSIKRVRLTLRGRRPPAEDARRPRPRAGAPLHLPLRRFALRWAGMRELEMIKGYYGHALFMTIAVSQSAATKLSAAKGRDGYG